MDRAGLREAVGEDGDGNGEGEGVGVGTEMRRRMERRYQIGGDNVATIDHRDGSY